MKTKPVLRAKKAHYCAFGIALVLALSACNTDDGPTGPPASSLDDADIVITAVDPDTATIDTTVTVRITGSGFTDSSTATWLIDTTAATQIRTLSTTWKSDTELEVVISISPDAGLRSYNIRIRGKKGKQGIAVEKFRVVAKPVPLPEPGTWSQATDINDNGVIVGFGDSPTGSQVAIRWTPIDSTWSYSILGEDLAVAINNDGLILSWWFDELGRTYRSRVHLPSGTEVELGPGRVVDISNDGTIIGVITDATMTRRGAVWRRVSPERWSSPDTLPAPTGFSANALFAISEAGGHVTGQIASRDTTLGVVWRYQNGQWQMPERVDLQLPAGAGAINDAGAHVGYVWPCNFRLPNCWATPAVWPSPGGVRRTLPTLYSTQGWASDLNNANQIVGGALVHYNDGSNPRAELISHAVIWFPGSQWPEDLGAIQPQFFGEATAISNRGWVVGWMNYNVLFEDHATVWKLPTTPVVSVPGSRR